MDLPHDPSAVRLYLYADHGASFPVWTPFGGPLAPDGLGLSDDLVRDLDAWVGEWEQDAYFGTPLPSDWEHRGRRLRRALQRQLGPGYDVS